MPPLRPSWSLKRAPTNWCLDRGVMTIGDRRRSTRRRCRQLATGPFVSPESDAYHRSCPRNSGADVDVADLKHASISRPAILDRRAYRVDHICCVINRPPYGFGEVRVATLALLTFTALSAWRSCGVVITRFSNHVTSRSSRTVFPTDLDVWVYFHQHPVGQAAERQLRPVSLDLLSHEGFLAIRFPRRFATSQSSNQCGPTASYFGSMANMLPRI